MRKQFEQVRITEHQTSSNMFFVILRKYGECHEDSRCRTRFTVNGGLRTKLRKLKTRGNCYGRHVALGM